MEAASTFAVASQAYARHRPNYPDALFEWIVEHCASRGAAWDCATGNGQAAFALASLFGRVEATDISAQQLAHAFEAGNINYSVQPAERTDFPDGGFDLVTVAQALHWFDFGQFWPEVRRVTKPGGLFCAWGYGGFEADERLSLTFLDPLLELLEPFWARQNQILWRGYLAEEIGFPFRTLAPPNLRLVAEHHADELVAYVQTWSAYKLAVDDAEAAGSLKALEAKFIDACRGEAFKIETPLVMIAGQVE